MNTKIALSGLFIVTALALTAGVTFALFSDTAQSSDNTFATGNADLQIAVDPDNLVGGSPGTYGNDIPAPAINETGMFPNFTKDYFFWLKNNSTSSITFSLAAIFDDVQTTGNADIKNQLSIAFDCGSGSTGAFPVSTWDTTSAGLGATLAQGAEVQCKMTATLANVDNTYQSSSVRFDGMFTGTQN